MTKRVWILILALVLAMSPPAGAASYSIIVQIAPGANIALIAATLGATVVDSIPGAGTYLLHAPSLLTGAFPLLGIEWAEPNRGVTLPLFGLEAIEPQAGMAADWYRHQPAMTVIRAEQALAYSTGRGIVIADINSQVDYSHPALLGHLTAGYDFVAANAEDPAALDQSSASFMDQSSASFMDGSKPAYSHGTLTAGILAVVAPDSMIMPLRVFDENGMADTFTIAKAIRYAVQQGAHVINMSFGMSAPPQVLKSAVEFARQREVLLTASAGNDNTSTPQHPAAYNEVMGAAATDSLDAKAPFSNYGSAVFASAPGVHIISAYPGGLYGVVSGTSFSAPAVAAAAALVLSLRRSDVWMSIAKGAVNIDSRNPAYAGQLGHGRIDVLQIVTQD